MPAIHAASTLRAECPSIFLRRSKETLLAGYAASYVDHEKRVAWFSISCDSVPIVMGLHLAALNGLPELHFKQQK